MLVLLRRLGVGDKATVHSFRSVASTILNESTLFNADWIEMQLAHVPRGVEASITPRSISIRVGR